MTRTERLNLRIDPDLLAQLRLEALKQKRSVSDVVYLLLKAKYKQGR